MDPDDIFVGAGSDLVVAELASLPDSDVLVIDLETKGVDPTHPDSHIQGVGLAWRVGDETHAKYLDYASMEDEARVCMWEQLSYASGIVTAYNLMFDGGWVAAELRRLAAKLRAEGADAWVSVSEPSWTHCTYALLRQLATEDFPGQMWGLKSAQLDLLGWESSNESGIETWLVDHGYHKQGPRRLEGESPEAHAVRVYDWESSSPSGKRRSVAADKSEMWRVPPQILGAYCILDCLSTLQLLDDVIWPALERFPELERWHREYFPAVDALLAEQQAYGIRVDVPKLEQHGEYLRRAMRTADELLRSSPYGDRVRQYEARLREADLADHLTREPPRFRKRKQRQEPARYTKRGFESKNWLAWHALETAPDVVSGKWLNWDAKRVRIETSDEYRFNLGSDDQRRWLLYGTSDAPGPVEWAGTDRTRSKRKGQKQLDVPVYEVRGINGWVDLDGTDSGELPTSGDLYTQLPRECARPLQLHADASQELGYVESYLACIRAAADGTTRIHPAWKSPGTKTLRLAGGGGHRVRYTSPTTGTSKTASVNLQQAPKTKQFMECLVADPATTWVEMDWSSLEPHVLAEISGDPALLRLYGPAALKHDVYLYSGAHYAVLGPEIRKYYDVDAPDVPTAKKHLKKQRDACKVVVLAKSYGAGAAKIHAGLRLRGFDLTAEEAKQISDSHDQMYAVSGKQFASKLEAEWASRKGWILSALGHPLGVYEGKKKDMVNRVCQTSGHDIHTMFVVRVARRLEAERIEAVGIVWDFHDQLIFQVAEEDGPACLELLRDEVRLLNELLGTYVQLKGEPKLSSDMAHAKEAEFDWLIEYPEVGGAECTT